MKKLPIILMLTMMLMITSASALDETEVWAKFGRTNAGVNAMSYDEGYYSSSNFTNYSYASYGSYYQPLIGSLDIGDSSKHLIYAQSAAYLFVFDGELNVIEQAAASRRGQPALLETSDIDNNTYASGETYIVSHDNNTIFIEGLAADTLVNYYTINYSSYNITFADNGIKCTFYPFDDSERCYLQYLQFSNSSLTSRTNGGLLTLIIPDGASPELSTVFFETSRLNHTTTTIPNIADIDDDNVLDIILWNNNAGFVVLEAGIGVLLNKDSIDGGETDTYGYNNPVMADINGGDKEIFYTATTATAVQLYCYDSAGTACAGYPITLSSCTDWSGGSNTVGKSNIAVITYESSSLVCAASSSRCTSDFAYGDDDTWFKCSGSEGVVLQAGCDRSYSGTDRCTVEYGWGNPATRRITAADFNNDGYDDILVGTYIIDIKNNNGTNGYFANLTNTINTGYASYWNIPVDIVGNSVIDIMATGTANFKTLIASSSNEIPTLTGDFGRDYGNPICANSTLRFSALENTNYNQPFAEGFDEERIVADCTGNGSITNGSLDGTQPYVDCSYPSSGSYYAKVYLQDEFNEDDFSQYRTVLVQAVSGTYGITCSISGTGTDPDADTGTDAEAATNDALEGALGDLFGSGSASDKVKMIIGLGIILGIIVTVLKAGGGFIGAIMAGFIGFLLVTFIGLIPGSILIIGMVGLVLMIVIGKFIFSGGTGGN